MCSSDLASALAWLGDLHDRAAQLQGRPLGDAHRLVRRFGCSPDRIAERGCDLTDTPTPTLADLPVYQLDEARPYGASIAERTRLFAERATHVVGALFPADGRAPEHLIHVTCTGYTSPSAVQRVVGRAGWSTAVTHAYHMGCYASLPAIRLAVALCGQGTVDVVHNEICSLHIDPRDHSPENLVVCSLFADGHIAYQVGRASVGEPGFDVLHIQEQLIPGTEDQMSWSPDVFGHSMTLSRHVPASLRAVLPEFLASLLAACGLDHQDVLRDGVFAVHPGGPRIIDEVREVLGLTEAQTAASAAVLRERGNMSSATLPHIWQRLVGECEEGQVVVSFAFGPGLTLFGSVFRYRTGLA